MVGEYGNCFLSRDALLMYGVRCNGMEEADGRLRCDRGYENSL